MKDRLKILLAEDDRDDSFLFQEALNRLPYNAILHIARDGEELIDILVQKEIPDFIFLDLNMPKKDGYDCLSYIRSSEKTGNITVIIMSTSSNNESVELAYKEGADLYIKKPDNFNALVRTIEVCLQRKDQYPEKPSKDEFLLMV